MPKGPPEDMASNKSRANSAMAISEKFALIVRMRQNIDVEFRKIEAMVKAEGHPGLPADEVNDLRLAHNEALHSEIINGQARWHNVAFDRGYFDVDQGPRKLSKSDQYK
jgi:hypothetical protein